MLPKKVIHAYIIGAIDCEGYDLTPLPETDTEKLQHVANCFKSEYLFPNNLKRYGSYQNTFASWLQGLPSCINIDFQYCDILEIGEKWGSFEGYPKGSKGREKRENQILANWFNLIAANTLQLFAKHKINYFI
jgi:hypothetical protein